MPHIILCTMLFLAPIVPVLSPKGIAAIYTIGIWLFLFSTVLSSLRRNDAEESQSLRNASPSTTIKGWLCRPVFLVLILFFAYALSSSLWSINRDETVEKTIKLFVLYAPFLFVVPALLSLPTDFIKKSFCALSAGVSIALCLYGFEYISGFMLYDALHPQHGKFMDQIQNRTLYCLFFFGAISILYHVIMSLEAEGHDKIEHRSIAALQGLLICSFIVVSLNTTMKLILILFVMGALFALIAPARLFRFVTISLFAATILCAPSAAIILKNSPSVMDNPSLEDTFKSRLEIWDMTARRSLEKPVLGWGLRSSPDIPGRGEISQFGGFPVKHLHPHNGVLQMWFELGVIGALFMLGLSIALIKALAQAIPQNRITHNILLCFIGVGFLYILPSFGLWQGWLHALLLSGALCLMIFTRLRTQSGNGTV
jgi:O-antigen ligase